MRKLIGVFGIGFLVVLAGCTGGVPGFGDTQQVPADGQSVDEFKQAHADALNEQGSYVAEMSVTQENNQQSQTQEFAYVVDSAQDRALMNVEQQGQAVSVFTAGETTYMQQMVGEDEAQYMVGSEPYEDGLVQQVNTTQSTMSDVVLLFGDTSYESTGTEMFDGDEMTVFEADEEAGSAAVVEGLGEEAGDVDVESFSSTMYVDADGIVRFITVEYDVRAGEQQISSAIEVKITGVGETSLDEPGWVEDAVQAQEQQDDGVDADTDE